MKKLLICLAVLALFVPPATAEDYPTKEEIYRSLLPSQAPVYSKSRGYGGKRPSAEPPSVVMRLQFDLNSDRLQSQSIPPLQNLAAALREEKLRGYVFRLEGHTCDLGDEAYNETLSLRRARAVKSFLVENGLSEFQFEMAGYGESDPMVRNANEAARRKNRRVVIKNTLRTYSKKSSSRRGLDVQVKKQNGGMETVVQPGEVLTPADNYAIEFQAGGSLHVYIFQLDSAGSLAQLFPEPKLSRGDNPVRAGEFHRVPEDGYWLQLDDQQGEERIIAMSSPRPLDNPKGVLEQQIAAPQRSVPVDADLVAYAGKTRGLKGRRADQLPDRGIKGIREDTVPSPTATKTEAPAPVQTAAAPAPAPKPAPNVEVWQLVFQHR